MVSKNHSPQLASLFVLCSFFRKRNAKIVRYKGSACNGQPPRRVVLIRYCWITVGTLPNRKYRLVTLLFIPRWRGLGVDCHGELVEPSPAGCLSRTCLREGRGVWLFYAPALMPKQFMINRHIFQNGLKPVTPPAGFSPLFKPSSALSNMPWGFNPRAISYRA